MKSKPFFIEYFYCKFVRKDLERNVTHILYMILSAWMIKRHELITFLAIEALHRNSSDDIGTCSKFLEINYLFFQLT